MPPILALVTALLLGSLGALHAAEPPFDPVRLDVLTPPIAPNLDRPGDVLYEESFAERRYGCVPDGWKDEIALRPSRGWVVDGKGLVRPVSKGRTGLLVYDGSTAHGKPARVSALDGEFKRGRPGLCATPFAAAAQAARMGVRVLPLEETDWIGGQRRTITCKVLIDATEYGDVIPLTGLRSAERHTQCGFNGGNDYPVTAATIEDPAQRLLDERECIYKTLGALYYFQHELGVNWSLAADEGYDTPANRAKMKSLTLRPDLEKIAVHLPQQPYVRECRRIIGVQTLTAHDLGRFEHPRHFRSAVAMGDYFMDLDHQRWYADVPWGTEIWRATQLLALYEIMDRPGDVDRDDGIPLAAQYFPKSTSGPAISPSPSHGCSLPQHVHRDHETHHRTSGMLSACLASAGLRSAH